MAGPGRSGVQVSSRRDVLACARLSRWAGVVEIRVGSGCGRALQPPAPLRRPRRGSARPLTGSVGARRVFASLLLSGWLFGGLCGWDSRVGAHCFSAIPVFEREIFGFVCCQLAGVRQRPGSLLLAAETCLKIFPHRMCEEERPALQGLQGGWAGKFCTSVSLSGISRLC